MPMKAIREEFNNELKSLLHEIDIMGKAVSRAVLDSVEALLSGNNELAQNVIKGDDNIDLMQKLKGSSFSV